MLKSKLKNIISLKLLAPLFLVTVFFVFAPSAQAVTNDFIAVSGEWNTAGNWSLGHVPDSSEDCTFTGLDGSGELTLSGSGASFKSVDFSTATAVFTFSGSQAFTAYGGITAKAGMTWSYTGLIRIYSDTTMDTAGVTLTNSIDISAILTIINNPLVTTGSLLVHYNSAGLITNSNNVTCGYFGDNSIAGSITLNLGTSIINCSNISFGTATLTITNTTHTINITSGATSISSNFGGKSWGTMNVDMTGGYTMTIADTENTTTFAAFDILWLTDSKNNKLKLYGNITVSNAFTLNGYSSTARALIDSNTKGTSRTITAVSVSVTNADFQDITGAGTGSWNLSAITGLSGDAGGNSGITFTTATSQYWHQGTGNWSDNTKWFLATNGTGGAGRVPLPQDDVYFDANSFDSSGQKITPNMPRLGKSIDFSTVANNPEFEVSIYNSVFGSLTFGTMIFDYIAWVGITFEGRGAYTFTSNGKAVLKVTLNAPGGSLTLTDALLIHNIQNLIINAGTFSDGGNNVTAGGINISGTATRSVIMSDGSSTTWTVSSGQNYTSGWGVATTTNLTFSPNQSTIDLIWTSATYYKIFYGGGLTYNNVKFSGINREVKVTGSNTFNNLEISPGVTAWFTAGTTNTFNTFTANGTTADPITINSTTAASHTFTKAGGGTVNCTHCSISNSTATPADTWYATFSTDGGNNSGWTFNSTQIYRSVGPGSTTALATSGSNAMTINGSTVAFTSGLPDNVGIGDVIQYDDGGSATPDSLAFISGRISSTHYTVTDITGDVANSTSANTNWSLFRAYTSLANAEKGVENTGIDSTLRNFDDWTAGGDATTDDVGKDIASSSEIWNIACYGDAVDSTAVSVNGWTTAATNYIKIYTPYLSSEVGVSQRHSGVWDEGKYRLEPSSGHVTISTSDSNSYVRVEGLQILRTNTGWGEWDIAIYTTSDSGEHQYSFNIIKGVEGAAGIRIGYAVVTKIWNNIIYDFIGTTSGGIYYRGFGTDASQVYNNTVVGCYNGILKASDSVIFKNNLVQNSINKDYKEWYGADWSSGDYNISEDDTVSGANSKINATVNFLNESNNNFHLAVSDTSARNAGADLSMDANLSFADDIDGEARPGGASWDIGADELKKTTQINTPHTNKWTDGLVGYWSFDGQDMDWASSTAEARDTSGNNNHGDVINGATPVIGKVGQGLEFDGVDDYVSVGDIADGLSEITVCAWVKADVANTNSIRIASESNSFFFYRLHTEQFVFTVYNDLTNVNAIGDTTYRDTDWHHVCGTYDGAFVDLFVDGADDESAANALTGTIRTSVADMLISDSSRWDGLIDEVRIYNRALSTDEIAEQYRVGARKFQANTPITNYLTDGLVGHWTFNGEDMDWGETTAEARDTSGNNNHGDVINGATPVIGKVGQGLEFDGVDDYVTTSDISEIEGVTSFTVSAWVNTVTGLSDSSFNRVISKMGGGPDTFRIRLYQDDLSFGVWNASSVYGGSSYTSSIFSSSPSWHHVVGVYNGTNVIIYVDTIEGTVGNLTGPTQNNALPVVIGGDDGAGSWNGLIDEVRIYNRALSSDEIGQLYQMGVREVNF